MAKNILVALNTISKIRGSEIRRNERNENNIDHNNWKIQQSRLSHNDDGKDRGLKGIGAALDQLGYVRVESDACSGLEHSVKSCRRSLG